MTTLEKREKPSNPLVQLREREEFPTLVTITLEGGSRGTGEKGKIKTITGVSVILPDSSFIQLCTHPKAPHLCYCVRPHLLPILSNLVCLLFICAYELL